MLCSRYYLAENRLKTAVFLQNPGQFDGARQTGPKSDKSVKKIYGANRKKSDFFQIKRPQIGLFLPRTFLGSLFRKSEWSFQPYFFKTQPILVEIFPKNRVFDRFFPEKNVTFLSKNRNFFFRFFAKKKKVSCAQRMKFFFFCKKKFLHSIKIFFSTKCFVAQRPNMTCRGVRRPFYSIYNTTEGPAQRFFSSIPSTLHRPIGDLPCGCVPDVVLGAGSALQYITNRAMKEAQQRQITKYRYDLTAADSRKVLNLPGRFFLWSAGKCRKFLPFSKKESRGSTCRRMKSENRLSFLQENGSKIAILECQFSRFSEKKNFFFFGKTQKRQKTSKNAKKAVFTAL